MVQSKREFFHKGINDQKKPDIIINLKRINVKAIEGWTEEQKKQAFKFLKQSRKTFKIFIQAIEESLS